ncbi:MAG: phosphocarrier protein HPr [Frankiaceae bacterium]|jgi:phosphocarrier protein|nr:phosphocarrier protein HPr [Frankiaceae bacterium]
MAQRRVVVASKVGLHARPAALFVKAAGATGLPVTIAKDGSAPADARSILSVLSLDVRGGDEVVVSVVGEGAEAALDELASILSAPDA